MSCWIDELLPLDRSDSVHEGVTISKVEVILPRWGSWSVVWLAWVMWVVGDLGGSKPGSIWGEGAGIGRAWLVHPGRPSSALSISSMLGTRVFSDFGAFQILTICIDFTS